LAIERRLDDTRLILALNPGDEPADLEVTVDDVGTGWLAPIALPGIDDLEAVVVTDGRARIAVPARSGRLLRVALDAA
jgi:hypothetical protein